MGGKAHPVAVEPVILQQIAQHLPPATVVTHLPLVCRSWEALFTRRRLTLAFALSNLHHGLPSPYHLSRLDRGRLGPAYMAAMLVRDRFKVRVMFEACPSTKSVRTACRSARMELQLGKVCGVHGALLREAVGVLVRDWGEAAAVEKMVEWLEDSMEVLGCIGDTGLLKPVLEAVVGGGVPAASLPLPVMEVRRRIASTLKVAVEIGNTAVVRVIMELRRQAREAEQGQPDLWRMEWEEEEEGAAPTSTQKKVTIPDPSIDLFQHAAFVGDAEIVGLLLADTNTKETRVEVLSQATTAEVVDVVKRFSGPNDAFDVVYSRFAPAARGEAGKRDTMMKLKFLFEDDRVVLSDVTLKKILMDVGRDGFAEGVQYVIDQGRRYGISGLFGMPAPTWTNISPRTVLSGLFRSSNADVDLDAISFYTSQPEYEVDEQEVQLAAETGRLDAVKMLLDHPSAANRGDLASTAGLYAARNGHLEIARLAVETYGARPCTDGNARYHCLLFGAAMDKHVPVLEMLVEHLTDDMRCTHLQARVWEYAFETSDTSLAKLLLPFQDLVERPVGDGQTSPPLDLSLDDEEFWIQLYTKYELSSTCLEATTRVMFVAGFKRLTKWLMSAMDLDAKILGELLTEALKAGKPDLVAMLLDQPEDLLKALDVDKVLSSIASMVFDMPLFSNPAKTEQIQAKTRCMSVILDNPILRPKITVIKLLGVFSNFYAFKALMDYIKKDPSFFDPSQPEFFRAVFAHRYMMDFTYRNESWGPQWEEENSVLALLAEAMLEDPRVDPLFEDGLALRNASRGMRWKVLELLLEHPKVKAHYGDM
ncbi:hypothetical protein HDU96_001604 [Phlyctochytrium bullatum]|nr:hypothetical protein HDU96_001604 [Phlyctochytrium bullatum]